MDATLQNCVIVWYGAKNQEPHEDKGTIYIYIKYTPSGTQVVSCSSQTPCRTGGVHIYIYIHTYRMHILIVVVGHAHSISISICVSLAICLSVYLYPCIYVSVHLCFDISI